MRQLHFLSLFLLQNDKLFHLFKYQIQQKYSFEFKDTYSYINVKQVIVLSGTLLFIALGVRTTSIFFHDELISTPNLPQYNILNWTQICGASLFLILSKFALKAKSWNASKRNLLTLIFCLFVLTTSFTVSYLFSQYNPKNTLTIFLTGVVAVAIFFALELKQILIISFYIILLFTVAMVIPSINDQQRLLNVIMSGVLAFFLYACSRYGYYFKAEQFVKVKQLEEKNAEVEELNQQKNEILGFVVHDLRNPLNNIEALSRMMLEENEHQDNTELMLIVSSAKQAKNIINDLIEVVQEEKMPLNMVSTELSDYLKHLCLTWQTNLNTSRQINLKTIESQLVININQSKFTRVIDNLIGNAVKFSHHNTPIEINVFKTTERAIINIRDFGIGIPDHLQSMLFDQFSKAGRPGLKGEKSIGLGLHISRQIIEQHRGTLSVQSKENEGTTFTISLPLCLIN